MAGLHRIAAIKSTDAPVFFVTLCGYHYFKDFNRCWSIMVKKIHRR